MRRRLRLGRSASHGTFGILCLVNTLGFAGEESSSPRTIEVGDTVYRVLSPEEIRTGGFPWTDLPEEENAATSTRSSRAPRASFDPGRKPSSRRARSVPSDSAVAVPGSTGP